MSEKFSEFADRVEKLSFSENENFCWFLVGFTGTRKETESNGRILQETPPDFVATMRILRVEMQSYRADNERLVKAQEEQNQLNAAMLQNLTDIQRRMNSGDRTLMLM